MWRKLKVIWGITAIRLSIIYSLIFGLVSVALITFMSITRSIPGFD